MEIGAKVNKLLLIDIPKVRQKGGIIGVFKCDCGQIVNKRTHDVKIGKSYCCENDCIYSRRRTIVENIDIYKEKKNNRYPIKTCKICKKDFENSILNFKRNIKYKDGLENYCKDCAKIPNKRKVAHWNGDNLYCLKCKLYLSPNMFCKDKGWLKKRNGFDVNCKECKKKIYEELKNKERNKNDLDKILKSRIRNMKKRSPKIYYSEDVTVEYLKELWNKQEGVCALSNIKMVLSAHSGKNNLNVSVDRIDSSIGYVKGNLQLVCVAVNYMKSDMDLMEFYSFCRSISETQNIKNNYYENKN